MDERRRLFETAEYLDGQQLPGLSELVGALYDVADDASGAEIRQLLTAFKWLTAGGG